jgi:hypothetical protein
MVGSLYCFFTTACQGTAHNVPCGQGASRIVGQPISSVKIWRGLICGSVDCRLLNCHTLSIGIAVKPPGF